jgi:hypothetical protein
LTQAAKTGVPAVQKQLPLTVRLLESTIPLSHNFNPFLEEVSRYVPELQALLANATAASQGTSQEGGPSGPRVHYLGALPLVNPDSLSLYAQRTGFNRSNAYQPSGASHGVGNGGMSMFNANSCGSPVPTVSGPGNAQVPQALIELLVSLRYIQPQGSTAAVPAPACTQAPPFTINGHTSQFPQVTANSK